MNTTAVHLKKLGWVRIQPLRNGDTQTVARLFDAAKPRLSAHELAMLARVDARSHSLVAWVEGDPEPAGFAQVVRDASTWTRGEISLAVADGYRGRGIGSALVDQLAADARAAGITQLTAVSETPNSSDRFDRAGTSVAAALSAA